MPDLLLELLSEEIPAGMQGRAGEDLQRLVTDGLKTAGLDFAAAKNFAGPRRLTLVVEGLPEKSPDISEERKGPRVGSPDKAIEGFLRGAGLNSIDEAEIVSDAKKGDFYVARVSKPGRPTADVIAELVPNVIRSFPWPKSQRWGSGRLRWVRPLHSILCLLGDEVVPFEVDGIASGDTTFGHRFMAPKPIQVSGFEDYAQALREAFVVLDAKEREATILDQARAVAQAEGLELVEDAALLAETAGLVEWPVALIGRFDDAFLDLPPEVIVTTIRKHQKCFSLRNASAGALVSRFILVANIEAEDGGKAIVDGNERVVRARLADAKFFWDQDRKVKLEDRLPELRDIIFHEKLGTQAERVERLHSLSKMIGEFIEAQMKSQQLNLVHSAAVFHNEVQLAAKLAKADLVTDMVGEFPDLQGVMGRYYALKEGKSPSVACAIEEHYRPQGPNDAVPTAPVSFVVALADKLDTLVGFWTIDETPTGSRDPYALRRAALGVIRIAIEDRLHIPISNLSRVAAVNLLSQISNRSNFLCIMPVENKDIISTLREEASARPYGFAAEIENSPAYQSVHFDASDWLHGKTTAATTVDRLQGDWTKLLLDFEPQLDVRFSSWSSINETLLAFFHDRLKVYLRDRGARHDLIDAVISPEADDLLMIVARVEALGRFLDTDDGANLLAGVKRAANILRIEEKKDKRSFDGAPDPALFRQDEERALAAAIDAASTEAANAVAAEDFEGAMSAIARLRAPVDAFFDHVTVNADDPSLRKNRLKLLNRIRESTLAVANLSKISG